MIEKNGIKAFSAPGYDYYELQQDMYDIVPKGAIFVHDPEDNMYGSIAQGCLKLCWTSDGNCYGLCANTVFLHYEFAKTAMFKKVGGPKLTSKIYELVQRAIRTVKELEDALEDCSSNP